MGAAFGVYAPMAGSCNAVLADFKAASAPSQHPSSVGRRPITL